MRPYTYFSDDQIETALGQLMRALSGFQVLKSFRKPGADPEFKRVPIVYGEMDRIVSHLYQKGDSSTKVSIPMISAIMTDLSVDQENSISPYHIDDIVMDTDDGPSIMNRIHGPAMKMEVGVTLWCSSRTELYQLLEQMLLLFNPKITINLDDSLKNSSYITQIELSSISTENNYPIGTGSSTNTITLSLNVPFRFYYPVQLFDALNGDARPGNRFGPDQIRSALITQITQNIQDGEETLDAYATLSDEDMSELEREKYVELRTRTEDELRTNQNGTTQKIDRINKLPPKE